jgi:4-alpha-glucanotransferase
MEPVALRAHAVELGVEVRYEDAAGVWHDADPEALAAVVDVLSADRIGGRSVVAPVEVVTHGPGMGAPASVRVAATVLDAVLELQDDTSVEVAIGRRGDGMDHVVLPDGLPVGCHRLSVRTASGDDACTVVVTPPIMPRAAGLAGRSGLFVPAYALWDDDAPLPSYRLLGRLAEALPALDTDVLTTLPLYAAFLDEPFDPSPYAPASRLHWNEVYLDDTGLPPAPVPQQGRYVDWSTLAARRRRQLVRAVDELDDHTAAELAAFVTRRPDVDSFARFMATRNGAEAEPSVLASHVLAQYLAERELAGITRSGGATLAFDLPIGCHPDGFERWAHSELFADAMSIGAPPDLFFRDGQSWGLPPQLPEAGRRSGHRLWRDLLARAGEHAALLRIDHVMAVHRLWWIPDGFGPHRGVYVRYPREELLAVIAAMAVTTDTTIVGENLGTVPDEVDEAIDRWDMLGMYEEMFHTSDSPLPRVPRRSVAGVRTHDMQPFASFALTTPLGRYRRRLRRELGRPAGRGSVGLHEAILERLARSDAWLVTCDLDDLIGELEPHNQPGRVLDTTWRRRLDRSLSSTLRDPRVERGLRTLGTRRHG